MVGDSLGAIPLAQSVRPQERPTRVTHPCNARLRSRHSFPHQGDQNLAELTLRRVVFTDSSERNNGKPSPDNMPAVGTLGVPYKKEKLTGTDVTLCVTTRAEHRDGILVGRMILAWKSS